MADGTHVSMLEAGASAWNKWRQEEPDTRPDLSGADLSRRDLAGANLARVDLSRTNLDHANLVGANLGQASLAHASLAGADLSFATLRAALLTDVLYDDATRWPTGYSPPAPKKPMGADVSREPSTPTRGPFTHRRSRLTADEHAGLIYDLEGLVAVANDLLLDAPEAMSREHELQLRSDLTTLDAQLRNPLPDLVIVERAGSRVISTLVDLRMDLSALDSLLSALGLDERSRSTATGHFDAMAAALSMLGATDESNDSGVATRIGAELYRFSETVIITESMNAQDPVASVDQPSGRSERLREARLKGLERLFSEVLPNHAGKAAVALAAGVGAAMPAGIEVLTVVLRSIRGLLRLFF